MRRRDFNIGLLIAGTAMQSLQAHEPTKQHRIAIVAAAESPRTSARLDQAFAAPFSRSCTACVASSKGGIRDGRILSQMPIHPLCIKHYELREYRFWREDTGRPG